MQKIWKSALKYAGIVIFFLVLAYGFVPQVLGGKIVNQSDISGYVGMAHEANEWNSAHPDDRTAWTNSMFGGMPTTMLTGNPEGDWTQGIYNAFLIGKRPATYLFIALLGAFLLMLSLGVNVLLAVGGAVAVAFCSYNFQIIQVGHNTKMMAIAWMPWVLAAVIFTYRTALSLYKGQADGRKWLLQSVLGAALFGMALNFQIKANHIQISYYLAIIIFCYVIGLFIWLIFNLERRKKVGRFFIASALLLFLGIAGIGANANKLIPMYRYSHQTMRGGSELSASDNASDNAGKSKGLDIEYATAWSYGWKELPNLMVPDFNGGSSAGAVNPSKSATVKLLKQYGQSNVKDVAKTLPLYWGPQPFTAGPMYMGAITIFLFLLGLFLCKGKDKWWILAATVIAICLGVGKYFMPFTEFWYNNMPFYSKFRTVSMALVALQVTLPMLGFVVLDKILKGEFSLEQFKKPGLAALICTAGFCFLIWLFPDLVGDFSADSDAQMHPELVAALQQDRVQLMRHDAIISAILIAFVWGIIRWYYVKKANSSTEELRKYSGAAAMAVSVLVILNMFSVGKRYLNADHFTTPKNFNGQFAARLVDKQILTDPALDYRVLDLTVNVFNDSHPSYWHKNIGGYSPVKMQRYQDLIDNHLTGEINSVIKAVNSAGTMESLMNSFPRVPVLSMLNDKYVILDENSAPVVNPNAMGNAWFVDSAAQASSANEEIAMLGKIDLHTTAVIGPDFKWAADAIASTQSGEKSFEDIIASSSDTVFLTSYAPNGLRYHYKVSSDRAVVFSEIYYPDGWTLKTDSGEELNLFRANWTLRGAVLPAGEHDLVMRFEPKSYKISSNISRASSILLILLILLSASGEILNRKSLLQK